MPTNYRSTKNIIECAARVIKKNYDTEELQTKYLKPFFSRVDVERGPVPEYLEFKKFKDLNRHLIAHFTSPTFDPKTFGKYFILSRTRSECANIHIFLMMNKIPCINKSGGLIFDMPHIKKVYCTTFFFLN